MAGHRAKSTQHRALRKGPASLDPWDHARLLGKPLRVACGLRDADTSVLVLSQGEVAFLNSPM